MKKILSIILTAVLCTTILIGCGGETPTVNNEPDKVDVSSSIVGIWVGEENGTKLPYQFNEDGTGTAAFFPMTYTIEGNVITISISAFGKTETGTATFDVKGNTITLEKDGETFVLTKTTLEELEK